MQDDQVAIASPFAQELGNAELEGLRRLAHVLDGYDPSKERDFALVIQSVLRSRFNQRELSEEFKVSVPTVSRWAAGESCPPSYARGAIVTRLREMLVGSAGSLRERLRKDAKPDA